MRKKPMLRLCALLLAAVFALGAAPAGASYAPSFSDVPAGEWYADYVSLCAGYGIINGYEDGTFRPQAEITRAEFMKLLCTIGELVPYKAIDTSIHWAAPNWDLLNDNGVLWGLDIPCTAAALDAPITRYEMCVMLSNFCANVFSESFVQLQNLQSAIADYSAIESKYVSAVEQAYGKGIITGYEDGSFHGNDTMTRAQAAAVVVRTAWSDQRVEVSDANEVTGSTPSTDPETGSAMDPNSSFAWQSRDYIDAWGHVSAEGRQILFGDANKSYFTGSEANLADYIVTVQVQTWDINSAGEYYTRTWNLEVNRAVAKEVVAIFEEIYASSERFPIHSAGRRALHGLQATLLGLRHRHQPCGELPGGHHHLDAAQPAASATRPATAPTASARTASSCRPLPSTAGAGAAAPPRTATPAGPPARTTCTSPSSSPAAERPTAQAAPGGRPTAAGTCLRPARREGGAGTKVPAALF